MFTKKIEVKLVHGYSKKDGREYYAIADTLSGEFLAYGITKCAAILDLRPSEVVDLAAGKEKK